MRAVGVNAYGGPESLEIVDLPEAHASRGEVRLRVYAATVNPTDTYVRNGDRAEMQKGDSPPYVPGMDAAGVIDEVGEGVGHLAVGDHVMAIVVPKGSHGAYVESLVLPADSVAKAPAGATHAEASTLPMNGLTARLSLDLLGLTAGQTLAVTGAAGAYGGYVVQLAKADGLVVIADAADADVALVTSLGADIVVPRGSGFADEVRTHFPSGVDGLADGSVQNDEVISAIGDNGAFTSVRGYKGNEQRGITFSTTWVTSYQLEQERLDGLRQLVEDGAVTLRVAEVFPAERAGDAHARLEAGGTRGRCVIAFD
ncbi:MAG: NADPH2:quinone reductase [Acidimicrobiales bacterium]|jgi:NADPH:quinone reductase